MKKGEITRRLNLLAGRRPPLPGHYHLREEGLRLELAECFKPVNAIEMLWVADIAYCCAAIEMYRVQVAGFRTRILKEARRDRASQSYTEDAVYSGSDRQYLAQLAGKDFHPPKNEPAISRDSFAILLGQVDSCELGGLRMLQQLLHDETKERDRLVNQLDRRRRLAMRDAIELAEAKQRAAAAGSDALEGLALPGPVDGEEDDEADFAEEAEDAEAPVKPGEDEGE